MCGIVCAYNEKIEIDGLRSAANKATPMVMECKVDKSPK